MFNKLNKCLKSKQLLALISEPLKCHQKRNSSKITRSEKTELAKSSENIDNTKQNDRNIDYLGIFDINEREVSGLYDKSGEQNNVIEKYSDLMDRRESKINEQNYLVTNFGRVRLDSDNRPEFHGQYDPSNSNKLKFNIQQFEEKLKNSSKSDEQTDETNSSYNPNIFEEQYFGEFKDSAEKGTEISSDTSSSSVDKSSSDLGFIDGNYFSNIEPLIKSKINFKFSQNFNQFLEEKASELSTVHKFSQKYDRNMFEKSESPEIEDRIDQKLSQKGPNFNTPLKPDLFTQNFDFKVDSNEKSFENLDEIIQKKVEEQMDIKLEDMDSTENKYETTPRTGAQYLEDLKRGRESPKYPKLFTQEVKQFGSVLDLKGEKLDSKGYRILRGQVFDYTKLTHEDILGLLVDSILFNDADLLAINKPYGMCIHTKESNSTPVLTDYLPKLSEHLETQKLYTVHRLDRDTTGVLLLAKTQEMAKQLNRMFIEHSIIKRYLCITRGVPDLSEGIIDIPIDVGKCDNKERMVLRPEALEEYKSIIKPSKSAKRAVTQYKVISEHKNAALIEVWPQTGVRHQIRVHLGLGLRCPILGDHKYSHLDKIVPQKLTNDMLLALNVRQAKVRHIPLHLHAFQYCLPNTGSGGRNIFINAPIPHHFHKNMAKLRLRRS